MGSTSQRISLYTSGVFIHAAIFVPRTDSLKGPWQASIIAESTTARVTQGHHMRLMRVISDAKGLECRVHMYAYDGVHDWC